MKLSMTRWNTVPVYRASSRVEPSVGSVHVVTPFARSTKFFTVFGACSGMSVAVNDPRFVTNVAVVMSVPFFVDVDQGTRPMHSGRCPGRMRAVRSPAMVSRSKAVTRTDREEWLLIGLMAAIWVLMLSWTPGLTLHEDSRRFIEISSAPGTPYRDFTVEYPPFETLLVVFLGGGSEVAVVWKLAIVNGASTLGCWLLLRRLWSRRVSTLFLWFALPIQFFMAFRLDALSVLMMLGAIVLADRRRTTGAGVLAASGVLFRI